MKYRVNFSGYCEIDADNEEMAKNEFWRLIQEDLPLPSNIYEIKTIKEKNKE